MDAYAIAEQSTASIVISIVCTIIMVIAHWKIFTKAGEKGWKAIIPIYNEYTMYELFWDVKMFWITFGFAIAAALCPGLVGAAVAAGAMVVGLALVVVCFALSIMVVINYIILMNRMSKSFGHGTGFTIGLLFLSLIFKLILAFGSSQYKKLKN